MTQAYQLAVGENVPITISQGPADIVLANPTLLRINGGANGDVLSTDGLGDLFWTAGGGGGGGGGGIPDAPNDGQFYGRLSQTWSLANINCGAWPVGASPLPNIQLFHSTTTGAPPLLNQGELAVCVSPSYTKMWLGDGSTNRLIFSTDLNDPSLAGQAFLKLSGGTMIGPIETITPINPQDATNKTYVDSLIAGLKLFMGTWQVAANVPNLSSPTESAGNYYICVTANPTVPEIAPSIPGIAGQTINNGDMIIWNGNAYQFDLVRGGGLTVASANGLYVQLAGSAMTGPLVLSGAPTGPNQAATKAYVDGSTGSFLPLGGGTLTGSLYLVGMPTLGTEAASKAYVDQEVAANILAVITDGTTILGNGTAATPLEVGSLDCGTF